MLDVLKGAVTVVAGSLRHGAEHNVDVSDLERGERAPSTVDRSTPLLTEATVPAQEAPGFSSRSRRDFATVFSREGRWYESMAHGWEEIEEHVSAWGRQNPEPRIKFLADRKTRAYVLPLDMLPVPGSVVASVAYWTPDNECLPYIVHHNPMTDPPILDVRDLLGKAQGVYATRDIFVIVLLPEIAALRGDLKQGARCRVSHPKNSIFVASMTDMSDFFVRVSSGALKHVALVFPAASRDEAAGNAAWHLCQDHLSTNNCSLLER